MTENSNTPNINNSQPNGASSVNKTPQGQQNSGIRPNVSSGQSNVQPRSSNYSQARPGSITPRPTNIPPRQSNGVGQRPQSPGNPNLSSINRLSSAEKFERGSRSLSHINGGSTGAKLYRINRSNEGDLMRRKVGGVMLDTDLIQDANKQKLTNTKSKRKTAVIVVLSILLVLSLAYLAVAIAGYNHRGKEANCNYYLTSEVSAKWMIDNNTETEFVVREGLSSGKVYEIESILIIDSTDKIDIKIMVTATVNGKEIFISGLYEAADNLVRVDGKNTWIYVGGHQGGGEVYMFKGIDFFGSPENLTSDNVKITVHAEITKA